MIWPLHLQSWVMHRTILRPIVLIVSVSLNCRLFLITNDLMEEISFYSASKV